MADENPMDIIGRVDVDKLQAHLDKRNGLIDAWLSDLWDFANADDDALSEKEYEFVEQMIEFRTNHGKLSEKQFAWLREIWEKVT